MEEVLKSMDRSLLYRMTSSELLGAALKCDLIIGDIVPASSLSDVYWSHQEASLFGLLNKEYGDNPESRRSVGVTGDFWDGRNKRNEYIDPSGEYFLVKDASGEPMGIFEIEDAHKDGTIKNSEYYKIVAGYKEALIRELGSLRTDLCTAHLEAKYENHVLSRLFSRRKYPRDTRRNAADPLYAFYDGIGVYPPKDIIRKEHIKASVKKESLFRNLYPQAEKPAAEKGRQLHAPQDRRERSHSFKR